MFFTNGALFAALLPRYPEVKDTFGLSNTGFGLLVVSAPLGAIVVAPLAGSAIRRFGTLRTNLAGSLVLAAAMAAAGSSGCTLLFAGALFVAGAADSLADAAQNTQGVLVETRYGRSLMNSFHAVWSAGAATGGFIGATAAGIGMPPSTQMLINSSVWAMVAIAAGRLALIARPSQRQMATEYPPTRDEKAPSDQELPVPLVGSAPRGAWLLLLPLVVLAISSSFVEDIASSWSALYLRRTLDVPVAAAGLGLAAMLTAQFIGRLVGDRMTDRWGRYPVAQAGGVLIVVGACLVAVAGNYLTAVAGFAAMGFGSATLIPAAFAAAGRLGGLPEGTAIAVIGWLMRIGFLSASPLYGRVADSRGSRTAMLIAVASGLAAVLIAKRLQGRQALHGNHLVRTNGPGAKPPEGR